MLVLAWRNLWRHRTRSLGAAVAVGFVVWMSILYFGLVGGTRDGLYVNLTDAVGHVQIHVRDYRDMRDFRQALIPAAGALRARIQAALPGSQVAATLEVPALLSGEDRARGAMLAGLDQPPAIRERFGEKYLTEGRLPGAADLDGIVLGGTHERGVWSLEPNAAESERILRGHQELFDEMAWTSEMPRR